jgi:hypothetical protein
VPADLVEMKVSTPTDEEQIELPFADKTVTVSGKKFKFRELSVQENDDCADAAKKADGTIDGRVMMRMMIINSSMEPKLTTKQLAKMPQRAYIRIYDVVNELNTLDFSTDEDEEGNA